MSKAASVCFKKAFLVAAPRKKLWIYANVNKMWGNLNVAFGKIVAVKFLCIYSQKNLSCTFTASE